MMRADTVAHPSRAFVAIEHACHRRRERWTVAQAQAECATIADALGYELTTKRPRNWEQVQANYADLWQAMQRRRASQ